uniref:CSON014595 protein n=1 Tax=Culicoides sonorensis TaxID=179676 RepID=A0A336MAY9_CULSO
MDFPVKLEQDSVNVCFACCKNDDQLYEIHEIKPEILLTYEGIVKEKLREEQKKSINLCFKCLKILNDIHEFQQKCIKSIEILNKEIVAASRFCDITIKEEIFVDEIAPIVVKKKNTSIKKPKKETIKKTVATQIKNNKKITGPKGKRAKCSICYYTHSDSHDHAIEFHSRKLENELLICAICEEPCKDVHELLTHLESSHKEYENARKCPKCDFETKNRKEFVEHLAHLVEKRLYKRAYPCEFCSKVLNRPYKYMNHIRTHFGALVCKYCRKTFFDKIIFEKHVESHKKCLETHEFSCDICGYVSHKKCLETHEFSCDICGYVVKSKKCIENHMITKHLNSKPFICDLCGKNFSLKNLLYVHIKSCHCEKNQFCVHCGKVFGLKLDLNHHIRSRHPENTSLKPKKPKLKIRKFGCDLCEMKFFSSHLLKKHQYSHTKTRPYNCNKCSTGYYNNEYLRKHYMRAHSISYTTQEISVLCGKKPRRYD